MFKVALLLLAALGCADSDATLFYDDADAGVDMSRRPLFPPVFEEVTSRALVDDFTLRAARLQSRQPVNIPSYYELPLRQHALWSGNNELGIETGYQPDGDGFQTILKLGEWGPPEVWTVTLGIAYDISLVPGGGDGQFGIDGLIRYGSGGVTQEVEVDWAEGVAISMPMNAVNVIARYSDTTGKNNTPADLRLRVNLAPGGHQRGFATKSTKIFIESAASEVVAIPKFARRLSVQRGFGSTGGAWDANMNYAFRGSLSAGDTGGFDGAEFLTSFAGKGVPIPPTARAVRVTNTTGSSESVLLIFHLGL